MTRLAEPPLPPRRNPDAGVRFAEFFSGIGLIRMGLERAGMRCAFANDVADAKNLIYARNFGSDHLLAGDVATLTAADVPTVQVATASFPCQDVSLAGNRGGLAGGRSGLFHEFVRILGELSAARRLPPMVLLENVEGLLTSNEGRDVRTVIEALCALGYACDLLLIDAVHFLPQSRPRVFIVAVESFGASIGNDFDPLNSPAFNHPCRPPSVQRVILANRAARWRFLTLPSLPANRTTTVADLVEHGDHLVWLDADELARELGYIRNGSLERLGRAKTWAARTGRSVYLTAYRRMRSGLVCLETRNDGVAGCLRTPSGGSSRQVLIEVGADSSVRMRYLTAREYGRLQGVGDDFWIPDNQRLGMHAFGDAVAVPVVAWLGATLYRELALEPPQANATELATAG